MKPIILIISILILQANFIVEKPISECEICGKYYGGREFYSWTTLELKPNGDYKFSESRHTMQSINDKGKWKLENDILILNSISKSKWKSPMKSKRKKKYFFKNQKCVVKGNSILIRKEKIGGFNLAYYTLTK